MPNVSLDTAAIVSTTCEAILYGFSLLMFIGTVWTMIKGRPWKEVNHLMLTVAVLLFILSTIHISVDVRRIWQGFVAERDTYPGGPVAFFANVAESTFVFKNAVYTLQTALGDGIVIYRCYKVWGSWWIIALPVLLWCSVAVTGIGSVYTVSKSAGDGVFLTHIGQWITSFLATTLTCNFISTGLLAYRLWILEQGVQGLRVSKSRTKPALVVVLDAGILYSATLLATLICFVEKSNGQYVVVDMIMPVISIAFYMIILRIANVAATIGGRANTSGSTAFEPHAVRTIGGTYQMRPMQVHIDQLTMVDAETQQSLSFEKEARHGQGSQLPV